MYELSVAACPSYVTLNIQQQPQRRHCTDSVLTGLVKLLVSWNSLLLTYLRTLCACAIIKGSGMTSSQFRVWCACSDHTWQLPHNQSSPLAPPCCHEHACQ